MGITNPSSGLPPVAPTVQRFTATGTTTGYLFTISTSSTFAAGDTYTNNSVTYTCLSALTAQTGQVMFCSGAGAPLASGTLTRASGAGTASIAFTSNVPLATYTTPTAPRTPLYLKIKVVGGGGGGGSSGTAATNNGGVGLTSFFGANVAVAAGGNNGGLGSAGGGQGGVGGVPSLVTSGTILAVVLGSGNGGVGVDGSTLSSTQLSGGSGGGNPLFGGGGGGGPSSPTTGATNTGGGGAGGGTGGTASSFPGGGGAGAAGIEFIITSPTTTYPYIIGTGGAGGTAGTSGNGGGAGAAGQLVIEEFYQ